MFNRDSARRNKSSEEGSTTTTKEEGDATSRIISSLELEPPTLVKFLYTPSSSSSVVRCHGHRGPFFAQTALIVLRAFVRAAGEREESRRARARGTQNVEGAREPFFCQSDAVTTPLALVSDSRITENFRSLAAREEV